MYSVIHLLAFVVTRRGANRKQTKIYPFAGELVDGRPPAFAGASFNTDHDG